MVKKTSLKLIGQIIVCLLSVFACAAEEDAKQVSAEASKLYGEANSVVEESRERMEKGRVQEAILLTDMAMEKLNDAYDRLSKAGVKETDKLAQDICALQERVSACRYQYRKQKTLLDDDSSQQTEESASPAKKAPPPANKPQRVAVPAKDKRDVVLADIHEVFKQDYTQKDEKGQIALAHKLALQARETKNDIAARYVLLLESRDAAVRGGDVELALQQVDQLDTFYKIDCLKMKEETLETCGKDAKKTDSLCRIAQGFLSLTLDAVGQDDYQLAADAIKSAARYASRGRNSDLAETARNLEKNIDSMKSRFEQEIKPNQAKLAENPADPAANLAVGTFIAYMKNDWQAGLPMIAKGSDKALAELANEDITCSGGSEKLVAVADKWWDISLEEKSSLVKNNIAAHAGEYYKKAYPTLTGFAAAKAKTRMGSVAPAVANKPAESHPDKKEEAVEEKTATSSSRFKSKWETKDSRLPLEKTWVLSDQVKVDALLGVTGSDRFDDFSLTSLFKVGNFKLEIRGVTRSEKDQLAIDIGGKEVYCGEIYSSSGGFGFGGMRNWVAEIKRTKNKLTVKLAGKGALIDLDSNPGVITIRAKRISNYTGEQPPCFKNIEFSGTKYE
jgi:hypothetical protein